MAEPLSISTGPNRGEAAFLGESSFDPIRFTEGLVKQEQQNRLQRKKEGEQELKALLTDDFKAKWDIDKLKYFDPKIKAFREEVITAFRENKGRLTPEQRILLENQKKAIQEEVLLSNTVQESYVDQVKKLKAAPGKYDVKASEANLKKFADPMSDPETAKELMEVYGGDVFKWRADNAMKYGLVEPFIFDKYVDEVIKAESISEIPLRDAKGQIATEKLPSGQYAYQSERRLTDEQANSLAQRTWNEKNETSQKAKDFALQMVDASYTIDDNGNLSFIVGQTVPPEDNEKIMQYLGGEKALAGLSKEEARNKLGKAYLAMTMERKSDKGLVTKLTSKDPSLIYRRTTGGGGGGDSDWKIGDPIKTVKKISYEEGVKDATGKYTGDITTTDREVTTELYLSLKPAKTTMGASSLTRNTANGKQVSNTKVKDIEYGDMAIVAVNKTTGQIMADEFLKDPKIKKNIKYTIVSFGNGKEDRPFGQPLNVSVYTPTEEVLNALMNAGGAKYGEKVKSKYDFMKAEADKLNKNLNKPATRTGTGNQQQQKGIRVTWKPGMPIPKNK